MAKQKPTYHEELLHWIWEEHRFSIANLQTRDDNEITIHNTGHLNRSDGPDFKNAAISIGRLRWHGDVEIHWKAKDWDKHGHQHDPRYNNVILHVIFNEPKGDHSPVMREDQSTIPTLVLKEHLSQSLERFLHQYLREPQIPCNKHLTYISEQAFRKQIQKAHKEYFELKVQDLMDFYDPDLVPSRAWKKLLTIALFDGLGISHNREPMKELGRLLFEQTEDYSTTSSFCRHAISVAGIQGEPPSHPFRWQHKGSRPNNHPEHRIPQAALALWHISCLPIRHWQRQNPQSLWKDLRASITHKPSLGTERANIMFGTVFLPALYILGNLFHNQLLKQKCWQLWQGHKTRLPQSLLKNLSQTALNPASYDRKLGTIHQLRHYCRAGRCQECFVFKNEISS